jgi:hypothetical protein
VVVVCKKECGITTKSMCTMRHACILSLPIDGIFVCSEMEDLALKTRRVIRSNNFTQQTNALDVDKHMYVGLTSSSSRALRCFTRMAYIEENLKIRSRPREDDDGNGGLDDPQEELYKLSEKWRLEHAKPLQEGSVTTSMSMLTAIPEVDLGME